MPRKKADVPPFRIHKATGQGYVVMDGCRTYLGRADKPDAKARYDRLVAEWLAAGRRAPIRDADRNDLRVVELADRYKTHARDYHREPDGTPREAEIRHLQSALAPLLELYETSRVSDFGPLKLKVIRERMVQRGWCRRRVNEMTRRLKRMFRWGVGEELVPPNVLYALDAVEGLRAGKTAAPDHPPVQPVADEMIDGTLPHLTPTLRAMVEILRLTGMRPGELFGMRPCDLDRKGELWTFKPATHKSGWRGRERVVFLGPSAQGVLEPYLLLVADAPSSCVFSPARSMREHRDKLRDERTTAENCGNGPGSHVKARPRKVPRDRFDRNTFAEAIRRACSRAFPEPKKLKGKERREWRRINWWTPYRLRHAFATKLRKLYGLEAVQVALGHAKADVSQIYAERDESKAREVARKIG